MSEKHTGGPWIVEHDMVGISEDGESLHTSICTIHKVDGMLQPDGGYDEGDFGPETCANGRLIAAAPDLLAACLKAQEAIRDNLKAYHYKNEPFLLEAFDVVKAAVAKAGGVVSTLETA